MKLQWATLPLLIDGADVQAYRNGSLRGLAKELGSCYRMYGGFSGLVNKDKRLAEVKNE